MTNQQGHSGYKFKIEIQDIFIRDDPPGYVASQKDPEIKLSVYGNSVSEVESNLSELIHGMKNLRWHKK